MMPRPQLMIRAERFQDFDPGGKLEAREKFQDDLLLPLQRLEAADHELIEVMREPLVEARKVSADAFRITVAYLWSEREH